MSSGLLRTLLLLAIGVALAGCKLEVVVGTGGTVQSESNTRNCSENNTCSFQVSAANFKDTFTAVPLPGYKFKGWHKGPGYLCFTASNPSCTLSNIMFKDIPSMQAFIASNVTFSIRPEFTAIAIPRLWVKDSGGLLLGEVMDLKNGTDASVRQVYVEKDGKEHGYAVEVNRMYLSDSYGYSAYWLNAACAGKEVFVPSPMVLEPLFSTRYLVARKEKGQTDILFLLQLAPPAEAKLRVDTYAMEDGACKPVTTKYPLVRATILNEDYRNRYVPPFGVYAQ